MLEYIDVCGYYNNVTLKDISFHIQEGDFFVIFGPDDSGKTELMEMLIGIRKPANGKILYKEQELLRIPSKERQNIRFVPDDIILRGNKTTAQQYFEQIMKAYKITDNDKIKDYAEFFGIDLTEKLNYMTYECNKFTAIIGAVLTNPNLLILDEPSNFLTKQGIKKLYAFLKDIQKSGVTIVILAEHFEEAAQHCNSYVYLKEGHIEAANRTDERFELHKAVNVFNANHEKLQEILGEPVAVSDRGKTYLYCESMGNLLEILSKCDAEYKELLIERMSMEEFWDKDYSRWE